MSAPRFSVPAWLEKARGDLAAARVLIDHRPAILDAACFHCQQSGEKALKAFLVFKNSEFEKSHNLVYLLDLCMVHDPEFDNLWPEAKLLTPYAVELRYPGDALSPPLAEAQLALDAATAIWNFVLSKLPTEYHLPL